jgi:predicted GH43/DUF377 family glycosyl hydrolase
MKDKKLILQRIKDAFKNKVLVIRKKLERNINSIKKPPIKKINFDKNLQKRLDKSYLHSIKGKKTKLELPKKGSFNGSILEIEDKVLCVYREDEEKFTACFLNKDYKVIHDSFYKLNLECVTDPRLIITSDNKVLLSYSKIIFDNMKEREAIAANIIMDLNTSKDNFFINKEITVSPPNLSNRQKNWVPFVYDGKTFFVANVCPHEVYEIDITGEKESVLKYRTEWKHTWFNNEQLRGNTNPVLLADGNYLSTFHTAVKIRGTHYYDNGFYIFEGKPPFKPIFCATKTYLRAEDANEPYFRKHNQILCTFPVGMTIDKKDKEKIFISYGDNDSCVKILETNLKNAYETMVKL